MTKSNPSAATAIAQKPKNIPKSALKVFSRKGFDLTTLADISDASGVSEGDILQQYATKKELLAAAEALVEQKAEQFAAQMAEYASEMSPITYDNVLFCGKSVLSFLRKKDIRRFYSLLLMDRFNNDYIQELYTRWCFDIPVRVLGDFFDKMIKGGFLQKNSSRYLAVSLSSTIAMYFSQYMTSDDPTMSNMQNFLDESEQYLIRFLDNNRT
jgi:AcrR family transcriptional regulator